MGKDSLAPITQDGSTSKEDCLMCVISNKLT